MIKMQYVMSTLGVFGALGASLFGMNSVSLSLKVDDNTSSTK